MNLLLNLYSARTRSGCGVGTLCDIAVFIAHLGDLNVN